MKWILVLIVCLFLLGCGPPSQKYHDWRDIPAQEVREEPTKFSQDPLLDSIYRANFVEMLRRCGSGKDECRKGN